MEHKLVEAKQAISSTLISFRFLPESRYERCFVNLHLEWCINLLWQISDVPCEENRRDIGLGMSFCRRMESNG